MKKVIAVPVTILLVIFHLTGKEKPKNEIEINSFVSGRVSIYYQDGEFIGYAPLSLERKKIRSPHILIKGDHIEDMPLSLPVNNVMQLNIRPLADARIADTSFISFNKLPKLYISTYEVFVHPKPDKERGTLKAAILPLERKPAPGTPIGRSWDAKIIYKAAPKDALYDPIFGSPRKIENTVISSLRANSVDIQPKYDTVTMTSRYVTITPVIDEYAFQVLRSLFAKDYFNFSYYSLKITYVLSLPQHQTKLFTISNSGMFNAHDLNNLFNEALHINMSLFLSDTAVVNTIEQANNP
jgi:hypothetical protein